MNKFKRFLANIKGSAFIENLMVYITVAVIGLIVVGIIGKTINDAAAGSKYQDEITVNGGGGNNGGSNEQQLAFFEEYGIWPGTYKSQDAIDLFNRKGQSYTEEEISFTINEDGTFKIGMQNTVSDQYIGEYVCGSGYAEGYIGSDGALYITKNHERSHRYIDGEWVIGEMKTTTLPSPTLVLPSVDLLKNSGSLSNCAFQQGGCN